MIRIPFSALARIVFIVSLVAGSAAAQTKAPPSKTILNNLLDSAERGQPDFDLFAPQSVDQWRQMMPRLEAMTHSLGPAQSMTYKVTTDQPPKGPYNGPPFIHDEYEAKYSNGAVYIWTISLDANGKIDVLRFHKVGGDGGKYD